MRSRRNQASVAAVGEDDVPLAQLAELRKVAEAAARDAYCELLAREVAAQHLTLIDPVFHQGAFTTMRELW